MGLNPWGPENILGFTTGLLTDTGSLFSGRFTLVGKSPATNGWGDANCGGLVKVTDGPYPIEEMHKPEYESLCASGTLVLNDDLFPVMKTNDLINRAGPDSISSGGVLAFAAECFENGLLTNSDVDGLKLRWGNAPALVALTKKTIKREGLGDLLADRLKRAFDPGFGISYGCEPTPGRHTISSCPYLDLQFLFKIGQVPSPSKDINRLFRPDRLYVVAMASRSTNYSIPDILPITALSSFG